MFCPLLFAICEYVHMSESYFAEIFENGCSPLEHLSTNSHASLGVHWIFIIIHQSLSIIYLLAYSERKKKKKINVSGDTS